MPENTETEGQGRIGSGHARSAMTINKELQANKTRIGSAKYYDIASALMGKGKADLEELFLNAARVIFPKAILGSLNESISSKLWHDILSVFVYDVDKIKEELNFL